MFSRGCQNFVKQQLIKNCKTQFVTLSSVCKYLMMCFSAGLKISEIQPSVMASFLNFPLIRCLWATLDFFVDSRPALGGSNQFFNVYLGDPFASCLFLYTSISMPSPRAALGCHLWTLLRIGVAASDGVFVITALFFTLLQPFNCFSLLNLKILYSN